MDGLKVVLNSLTMDQIDLLITELDHYRRNGSIDANEENVELLSIFANEFQRLQELAEQAIEQEMSIVE